MLAGICVFCLTLISQILTGCGQEKEIQGNVPETQEQIYGDENTAGETEETYIPVKDADTETIYAENEPDRKLADFLITYYEIPEEYQADTRYYYDRIDLNSDGKEEVIAVVVGEYTEQPGGDPALILSETQDGFEVLEDFPFIRTPVYVSEKKRDGWSDLIMPYHGNGDGSGYLLCHHTADQGYQSGENELLEDFDENFSGKKILANNFIDDMDKGNYLTLGEK